MDHLQNQRRILRVQLGLGRQIVDGQVRRARAVGALDAHQVQITLFVEISDDQLGEAPLGFGEVTHLQLPQQVILQIAGLG